MGLESEIDDLAIKIMYYTHAYTRQQLFDIVIDRQRPRIHFGDSMRDPSLDHVKEIAGNVEQCLR